MVYTTHRKGEYDAKHKYGQTNHSGIISFSFVYEHISKTHGNDGCQKMSPARNGLVESEHSDNFAMIYGLLSVKVMQIVKKNLQVEILK